MDERASERCHSCGAEADVIFCPECTDGEGVNAYYCDYCHSLHSWLSCSQCGWDELEEISREGI